MKLLKDYINPNELIKNIINEQMKTYINEINELNSFNELINNKLEENNKEIISLKKKLEEKNNNNISSNDNIDVKIIDKKVK